MSGSSMYAAQKSREAIHILALSEDSLRHRVLRAWVPLNSLTGSPIPDATLQAKLEDIVSRIQGDNPPIPDDLKHLSDPEIHAIAEEIVSLFEGCAKLYGAAPGLVGKPA